ncbi:HNH endonuclease signature motif containing protein [Nocardioides rubriscoriae]|uniref:HNH endonuclease signature motif containing protein n=1 Tax=Nocardioides rubriscoriae TaxID=642762 RepID=UPI0011DFC484|nr:HNH endonuclease signature motif containing protein [Nocardioides rubriscoriae]
MSTRTRTRSSDPLLESVRAQCDDESRAQVAKLNAVLDWAMVNTADAEETAALLDPMEEPALHLGGAGCPVIGEYAALDLALSLGMSLGMSTDAGLAYLGKALELRYRLPRLYARVVNREVPVWKAFRVAEHTTDLPLAGAGDVDKDIAPFLHTCSWAQVDRAVDAARAKHDPDEAERRRKKAAEHRHADVHLGHANTSGTVEMTATLDLADAIDLEAALKNGAQALADLGSTESLDVRRSQALGEMGRQQLALDLLTGGTGRGVTLYAHLDAEHPDLPGFLDNTWSPVLIQQIRAWCQQAGTKVTIKPVIDLAADPSTEAYEPTDAIRELVRLRDHTCVFPGCTRRRVDLDHIVPFSAGGPTSAHNLAMLCRRHHRAKTHSRWRYVMLRPGLHHWTSPTGATFLVDRRPPLLRPPRRRP